MSTEHFTSHWTPEIQQKFEEMLDRDTESRAIETVTAGALNPAIGLTLVSVTGTQAYTLADGTRVGQRKQFRCTVAASVPDGTLTPSNFADGTSIDIDAVNEAGELIWDGSNWRLTYIVGSTVT